MQNETQANRQRPAPGGIVLRIIAPLLALALTFWLLRLGFVFLAARDSGASPLIVGAIAIVWGVGGVAMFYFLANWLAEGLPERWRRRIHPFIFVGPAMALLAWFLLVPTLRTLYFSFFDNSGARFVGLDNYATAFSQRQMQTALRNNLMWMIAGTFACVALGLLIAVLADRSRFERLAKSLIFLPMAISFVGAGVIWRFMYAYTPPGEPQIGLLNALYTSAGGDPQPWLTQGQPWNNLFLIAIMIWLQTGFAMVIFSAAIKGIPEDLLDAARIDGANEIQIFFKMIIPSIWGTIITVTTTIVIFTLKIFDVVIVMTGGNYGTEVVATEFYREYFRNPGQGSAIAMLLFIAVIPVIIYNLRQLGKQETF